MFSTGISDSTTAYLKSNNFLITFMISKIKERYPETWLIKIYIYISIINNKYTN